MYHPAVVILLLSVTVLPGVRGHGRLVFPPARSTMWRKGFSTPINYDDNQLFCGGFDTQWNTHGGECGVCGDEYKPNGEGAHVKTQNSRGKFYTNVIGHNFTEGQSFTAKVDLTANHKGWFEFRLCKLDGSGLVDVTKDCLNENLLSMPYGTTRYDITTTDGVGLKEIPLNLPEGLTCNFCVLQWRYHAGNNWGSEDGCNGLGCGPQEEFYGCANIAIRSSGRSSGSAGRRNIPAPTTDPAPDPAPDSTLGSESTVVMDTYSYTYVESPGTASAQTSEPDSKPTPPGRCQFEPVGIWRTVPGLYRWCVMNCNRGYCPRSHCTCA